MTVNTTNITSGPYEGNDVTTEFSYTFRVDDKTQLIVYETDDNGTQTQLTVDTDYTVDGIGDDDGGTLTRVDGALPTGYSWYIRSNYEETQETAFDSQGGFFPRVHERAFDKLTFLMQQFKDRFDRTLRIPSSDEGGSIPELPIAAERANKFIQFDSVGNPVMRTAAEMGVPSDEDVAALFLTNVETTYFAEVGLSQIGTLDLSAYDYAVFDYTDDPGDGEVKLYKDNDATGDYEEDSAGNRFVRSDISVKQPYSTAYAQTLSAIKNGEPISVFRFIPKAKHSGLIARTNVDPMQSYFQNASDSLIDERGGGRLWVPASLYYFEDQWVVDGPIEVVGEAAIVEGMFTGTYTPKGSVIQLATGSFNDASKGIIKVIYNGAIADARVGACFRSLVVNGNRGDTVNPTAAEALDNNTYGIGFEFVGARYGRLENCFAIRCAEDGMKCSTGGSQSTSVNNLVILGNAFIGNGDDGIDWSGGDSFFAFNQCGNNGGDGIACGGAAELTSNGCWDNYTHGLRISTSDVHVVGGKYYDNQQTGILVSGTVEIVNLTGPQCHDNGKDDGQTDAVRSGIRFSGDATNCTVSGANSGNKQETGTTGQQYGLRIDSASASVAYGVIKGKDNGIALISDLSRTAIDALSNNSGGTLDGNVGAISGSGADTGINNNFAEVTTQVNKILTLLQSHGIAE